MSDPADASHPIRVALATAVAFVSGMLAAMQSRINGQLSLELHDGFVAALVSFGSGLLILSVAMLVSGGARRGIGRVVAAVRDRSIPVWYLLGGALGAFFVLTQSLVVGLVGVALFTVGVVAGQMTSSVVVDRRGLGTMAPKRLTVARVAGAVLALVGVAIAVSGELTGHAPLWLLFAPILAGLGVGLQPAINGQVRRVAGSAITATFGNFLVGTALLGVAVLVHLIVAPWPHDFPASPWLYLGGAIGVVFIFAQVVIVRVTGVLLLGLAVLSGQVAAAGLFDLLLPIPGHQVTVFGLVGTAVTLLAVLIAVIPGRRITGSSGRPSP